MPKSNFTLPIVILFCSINSVLAQNLFTEVGLGIGNVTGGEHTKGKAEIYVNVLKSYGFGELGLDISTGGNFIPGTTSAVENNIETLASNDAKFSSITAFGRLAVFEKIYIEPRFGYASLFYWVHADNEDRISESKISYGLGVGTTISDNFSISLRYQHLGNTPEYEGSKDATTIISKSEPLQLVLLRIGYRFNWDTIF